MADQSSRTPADRTPIIPDGGLRAGGLPDWMQARPEWSDQAAGSTLTKVTSRAVPDPDTSTIELSAILDTDDLPEWLQAIARRSVIEEAAQTQAAQSPRAEVRADEDATSPSPPTAADLVPSPWWASDRMMAGLLIAVVLTILFVLITTIRLT